MDNLVLDPIRLARDFISRHYGIHHPGERLTDLERKLTQIAQFLGYPQQIDLIKNLLAGQLSATELQQLVEALTVGKPIFSANPMPLMHY